MRKYAIRGGLLVLALGLVYGGLDFAGAAPTPPGLNQTVTVANSVATPVPVQQQGTATVNVSNASIPVTGTVKTSAADNPAFQPINRSCSSDPTLTGAGQCFLYTVPTGKELVVTDVSVSIHTNGTLVVVEINHFGSFPTPLSPSFP